MEYFIGSISTLLIFVFGSRFFLGNTNLKVKKLDFTYRQSHIHEVVKPLLPNSVFMRKPEPRQSRNHEAKTNVRVIMVDNKAYWVKDNLFYIADMNDGIIDADSTRLLDIMSMDKVQLDKILFIIDRLKDGE
jgi:hypothetical protein